MNASIEKALLELARRIDEPAAQREYVKQVCLGDRQLESRLTRLLENAEQIDSRELDPTMDFEVSGPEASTTANNLSDPASTKTLPTVHGRSENPNKRAWARGISSHRFDIIKPHAKGGLGQVSLAHDYQLHREVALKEIREDISQNDDLRRRFLVEAEITGRLEHPGIVPVYELGEYGDGSPYYAMKFIRGENLGDSCKEYHNQRKPKPSLVDFNSQGFRGLLRSFVDVCNTVEYAHSRGVIHRDIKPSNIMLGKYGETLLVDWGLAKALDKSKKSSEFTDEETLAPSSDSDTSETQIGQAVGTPSYMSPESVLGNHDLVGPATDVYCLGGTLYWLLTGFAPHQHQKLSETRVVNNPRLINQAIPKALDAICMKSLAQEVDQRYSSATELASDVERWMADEAVTVVKDSIANRFTRFVKRHRSAFLTLSSASLVLIGTLVAFSIVLSGKNSELRSALDLAHTSQETAEEQRLVALNNAKTSRALGLRVAEIAEQQLSTLNGQEVLRESLMDDSYELFSQQLADYPHDPDAARNLARIARLRGNLKGRLKKSDDAVSLLNQSLELQRDIDPSTEDELDYLAETLRDRASLAKTLGNLGVAEKALEEAFFITKRLVSLSPSDLDLKRTAGSIDLERVGLYEQLLEPDDALAAAERCVNTYTEIIRDQNERDLDYVVCLLAFARKGQFLSRVGRIEEAERTYRLGLELGKQWIERSTVVSLRFAYAKLVLYFASDQADWIPMPETASETISEAIDKFQILVDSRKTVTYRYYLGCSKRTSAKVLLKRGMIQQAVEDIAEATSLLESVASESDTSNYRSALATAYAIYGQIASTGNAVVSADWLAKAVAQQELAVEMNPGSLLEQARLTGYLQQID